MAPQRPEIVDRERLLSRVPDSERHGTPLGQFRFWFLSNFQFYAVSIGFIGPSLGLSFGWSLVAGVLGMALGTTFMALHGSQGPQLGLAQMIQSRAQFGHRGVVLPILAASFVFVASSIISFTIIGSGMETLYGIPRVVAGWGVVVLALLMALLGYTWLHRLYSWILYASLPFVILLTIGLPFVSDELGAAPPSDLGFTLVGFVFQFTASASYNITLAPYVSDYTRYMPRSTSHLKMVLALGFGAGGSGIWMIGIGAFLAARLGIGDALQGMRDAGNALIPGLGEAAALSSVAVLIGTVAMNCYSSTVSVATIRASLGRTTYSDRARRVTIVLVAFFIGLVGSTITGDAITALNAVLTMNLALLVPWTAINLVDYFLLRHGAYVIDDLIRPSKRYGTWSVEGLAAYGIGLAAMAPFLVVPGLVEGPLAWMFHGADLSWVLGLLVSAVAYALLVRLLRKPERGVPPVAAPPAPDDTTWRAATPAASA